MPAQIWAGGPFPITKMGDCPVVSIQQSTFSVRLVVSVAYHWQVSKATTNPRCCIARNLE